MNKLFTKIVGAALGLTMAIGVGVAVGSNVKEATPVHAADTKVSMTTGSNTVAIKVNWNSAGVPTSNNGVRMGTSSNAGSATFSIPSGTTKFGFYAVGWNGKSTTASVSASVGTIATSTASLTSNSNASGTINANATVAITETEGNAKKEFTISGVTAASTITLTTSGSNKRLIAWDAYYVTADKTLSSISVSTAPTKTSYLEGEYFSPSGLVIRRTYTDSTSDTYAYAGHTSEFSFLPTTSTALTTSNTSITITYGGKSTSQAITVTAPKTPASLATTGQTTSFEAGDTFTYGGTSTVTYTDSTSKSVTPSSFKIGNAGINPISAGTVIVPGTTTLSRDDHNGKTVYVLYTENATTVYTSYTISVAAVNKVIFTGGTDKGSASGQGQSDSLTKSGVTMACDSCYTTSGAYRFYSGSTLTISSTVGNIAQIEFNMNESYNSNLLSTSTGTYNSSVSTKGIWTGDAASIDFDLSAQARVDSIVITLASNDPTVELDATSATEVSMMRGDTNTSVKVLVKNIDSLTWNFTFDEDEDEGLTTSSYISVSASALISNVSTLTITTKAVGSTTMHISVSGTACETTVPVAVAAKPASMAVVHGDISEGHLEIQTGTYKQVSFSGLDTDGKPYSIAAADVTPSTTSGASYVSLSGSRITGDSQGTAVVRYTLKALTSVYAEVTVDVVDDYKTTVNSITFNSNLIATQGDPVDSSNVFATKVANTHFLSTKTIEDSELLFSYENNRSGAVGIGVFSYDFSHGTTVDSTHKSQAVYVFTSFDESYSDSFTITVEQKNDPLTAITITNVTSNAKELARGDTFQLEIAYTPTNPTDGKEVTYRVDHYDEGVSVSVNSTTGLISVAASSGLGEASVVVESSHDATIRDYVNVTVVLESMKYVVNEPETLTAVSTVSAGDRVYMVATATDHSNATYEFNGYPGTYGGATSYTTNIAKLQLLEVEAGSSSGTVSFKLSGGDNDGEYISYSGSSNTLNHTSTKDATSSWTVDGSTITNASTTARQIWLNWNNGTPRFACYTNKTSTTGYYCPTFIKVTGGNSPYDVTETLFNGVHNNFGTGKTYEWDASCSNFDDEAWFNACDALMSITGYSNYKLNRAVGNMAGNEIEVFLAKYDAIIGKFGTTHDYLDRFAQGGINYGARIVNPINVLSNNGSTIAIIVIISTISVTCIGGYFFLRKRKEN